jgi:hypothetical protein
LQQKQPGCKEQYYHGKPGPETLFFIEVKKGAKKPGQFRYGIVNNHDGGVTGGQHQHNDGQFDG